MARAPSGEADSFSTGSQAWGIATADFNGDGLLDLAVAEGAQSAPRTAVWLGASNGGFTFATALTGGNFPIGVATGDFNGDGKIDIATAHNVSGGILVYSGNGLVALRPASTCRAAM